MSIVSRCETLSEVVRHGFQRADEGDLNELFRLGFSIQWIKKIQDLPSRRRNQACDLLASYLSDVLHQELGNHHHQEYFTAILSHVNEDNLSEAEQDKLVYAKASREMMNSLYGMTNDEFRNRRKALGITKIGRPHRVSPKQEEAIWTSWRRQADLPYPKRFLQVAQETRLDLRTLWPVLRPALGLQENRRYPCSKRSSRLGAATEPLSATGQQA